MREIAEVRGVPRFPVWSPDGSRIRFSIDEDSPSRRSLWEMRSSGDQFGALVPLAKESMSEECCLSIGWTSSGAFLADSLMARGNYHLWLNPAQAANGVQEPPTALLSGDRESFAYEFAPGPDSNSVFTLTQSPARGELIEFDQRSGHFTTLLPGVSGQFATYAPDSRFVAYVKTPEQTLWRSRADGTDSVQLTTNSFGQVQAPSWSRDGTEIAFTAKASGRPWRIYVIGRDGGVPHEISIDDDEEGGPSWSPDGGEIAYANVMCQERHNCAVHVVELATGKSRILPGSAGLRTARWSPDGRSIAALQPERQQLMLYSFERGAWTKLAEGVNGDDVNWTRDSRFIFVDSPIGDKPVVKKVDVKTGGVAEVVSLERFRNMIGEFGVWFALAPDNSPIFYRRLTSSEIYRLAWEEK